MPEDSRPLVLSNLPAQVSSFVGRDGVLADVTALVAGSRLVTLTGAGGAGKTRLGLEVAAGLLDGAGDGVWFADLAPLRDPDLVARTVADVLGVRLDRGQPALELLVEAVGSRSLLLLIDNCEHLLGACAKLADGLLRSCPNLALLATSREPLGIDGEHVYRVPSMEVPDSGAGSAAIRASESVRLLVDRADAQGVQLASDEEAVQLAGRICRRLDGIPLAIELAAARLRVMPAAELEGRLDERFALLTGGSRARLPRQQTLRAMADWSWELLTSVERTVLARLSVFAGSFDLAAAEVVASAADVPAAEVFDHLGALVDKSLVQFGDTGDPDRYRLLETIRRYAAGRLEALDPTAIDATRLAHRDFYLALAEEADPRLFGADQTTWLDRLDAELGNLRAAIAFSATRPDLGPGLRILTALRVYWLARGHAAEAVAVLRSLLDTPAASEPTLLRARALTAAVSLIQQTGDYAIAERYSQEALAIARVAADERLVVELLNERAWLVMRQGQPAAALPLIEAALGPARQLHEFRLVSLLLSARALTLAYGGDDAGAVRDAAESLEFRRRTGDRRGIGHNLGNLGTYELSMGDVDAARVHLRESLAIAREVNDRSGILHQLHNLGVAEYLSRSMAEAGALFAESLDLARRMGMRLSFAYSLIGVALVGYGDDPRWSARLHGAADHAFAELGHTVEPLESRLTDLSRQRLRAALGDETFEAEYAAGRALDQAGVLAMLDPVMRAGTARERNVLTPRELEVLGLVAQGLSNTDIAQQLLLSEHTVHRHLANIMRKLGVSSRAAAAAWGVQSGLL
jgi:predicted ATPase/DNA-binding CsgD family transcriptional regulator